MDVIFILRPFLSGLFFTNLSSPPLHTAATILEITPVDQSLLGVVYQQFQHHKFLEFVYLLDHGILPILLLQSVSHLLPELLIKVPHTFWRNYLAFESTGFGKNLCVPPSIEEFQPDF